MLLLLCAICFILAPHARNHTKAMEPQDIPVGHPIGPLLASAPSPSQVPYFLSGCYLHNMFLSDI